MSGVWVISDVPQTSWELLSKARELAGKASVTAYVVGDNAIGQETITYGADTVKLMEMPAETTWEQYVELVAADYEKERPEIILVGADRRGKDFAAQLAALLDIVCISECKSLVVEGDHFEAERIVFGGLAVKKISCQAPLIVTISARTFEARKDSNRQGIIIKIRLPANKMKVKERRPKPAESVNIAEADVVIGIGRGFSSKDEMKLAEDLAKVLGGELGCTRSIAEDMHWLPEDRYIGISGQVIKPKLYICAGISGQVQHVYGIRDAKTIVAIDKNENAPIFQVADYYVVGDLNEALPALKEAILAIKEEGR